MLYIPSPHKEHDDDYGCHDEDGSEIGLKHEEKYYHSEVQHVGEKAIEKIRYLRMTFFEKICQINDEPKFHKFHRLE